MSLDNTDVIDAAGLEMSSGAVVLTIVDSWEWSDVGGHLVALQNKLNAYLEFVESRQIEDSYPLAVGRSIVIDVVNKYSPPQSVVEFLDAASKIASLHGITLRQRDVLD